MDGNDRGRGVGRDQKKKKYTHFSIHERRGNSILPFAPVLFIHSSNIESFCRHNYDNYIHKHNLEVKANHLHGEGASEIEKRQVASRLQHVAHEAKEDAALDQQRGYLRESSLPIPKNKKEKINIDFLEEERETKRRRIQPESKSKSKDYSSTLSLAAVNDRLVALSKPRRYDTESWLKRRKLVISKLNPLFPNVNFEAVCERVNQISLRNPAHGLKNLSASDLFLELKQEFPSPFTSVDTCRIILKLLCFGWLKTHSSYYDAIFDRYDIVEHRNAFVSIWRYLLTSPNVFLAIGDGSFQHQNERNSHGWIDKTRKLGDEVPSGAGLGSRVNFWTFLTPEGILEDNLGNTTTIIPENNSIMDSNDIISYLEKGAMAMSKHPLGKGKLKVMAIDGAIINKMFSLACIIPSKMNAGDGGKNRNKMKDIGFAGLHRVLEAMGAEYQGLDVDECRKLLWESDVVRSQFTAAEEVVKKYGVLLIYSPKSPPRFSICEPFFRFDKRHSENLFDVALIRNKIVEIDNSFLISKITPENRAHLEKWVNKSLKYAEYFSKGGNENIRENDMDSLVLEKVGHSLPPLILVRDPKEFAYLIHEANWILIRGKHYPKEPKPWTARENWQNRL